MASPTAPQARIVPVLRWIARIAGSVFALALAVMLASGISSWTSKGAVDYATMAFLLISIIGLVLAWFWELVGGAILLGVAAVILSLELSSGVLDGGPFVFGILGALFLTCWWASRPHARIA